MRQPLVIGNWKMHGGLVENRDRMLQLIEHMPRLGGVEVAICPPFPYLIPVRAQLTDIAVQLGAQNLNAHGDGAHTGEVNAAMLQDLGCRYVLVGHSERRALYGDSDAQVADKVVAALAAGLTPVLCVGETLEQRQAGKTTAVVSAQINAVLDKIGITELARIVIAYEPVWAIGTGETASPEQAQTVHQHIRQQLSTCDAQIAQAIRLLYGGSVKPDNAGALFDQADIDGGLIGGASLDAQAFVMIVQAAQP